MIAITASPPMHLFNIGDGEERAPRMRPARRFQARQGGANIARRTAIRDQADVASHDRF